ncbi:hypothetical protein DWY62_11705 [Bacteroides sp. AF26-10BH]|nr:hypothetical protein DXD78_09565 [Bacteroides sp. D20]RGM36892.1 hypothetical protein DXC14_09385 [Bacteroides sp. D20]RJV18639.1 hypothetical protein DWY62_11705 [Bacteroides sp. AF26-10BH]HCR02004.1 hypothetical protein [Bacteroides uniformis]HCZ28018.1 hypothetical protein [Bacteroides uniformis]
MLQWHCINVCSSSATNVQWHCNRFAAVLQKICSGFAVTFCLEQCCIFSNLFQALHECLVTFSQLHVIV